MFSTKGYQHDSYTKFACGASLLVAVTASVLLLTSGCAPSDQPELAPVTGLITLDGKPLANKQVVFTPEAGGRASMAITNEKGEYELKYTARIKGGILGKHTVTVSTPRDEYQTGWTEAVPAKFNRESTLTAEVLDDDNEIDFLLQSE